MNVKEYGLKHVDGKSFTITEEMIKGDKMDVRDCAGARLLKSLFPKEYHKDIQWGRRFGFCNYHESDGVLISSNMDLMEAKQGDIIELKVEQNT